MRVAVGSDLGLMRVLINIFFSVFSVFLSKNFGGFFDFRAVASRKLRKIRVIFPRKNPRKISRKFRKFRKIPENSGKSGKIGKNAPQKFR